MYLDSQTEISEVRFMKAYYFIYFSADDIVKKVFSLEFASQSAHHKAARAQIIEQYQMRPGDTGSTPVQSKFEPDMMWVLKGIQVVYFNVNGNFIRTLL